MLHAASQTDGGTSKRKALCQCVANCSKTEGGICSSGSFPDATRPRGRVFENALDACFIRQVRPIEERQSGRLSASASQVARRLKAGFARPVPSRTPQDRAGESSRTLLTHASCGKSDRLRNVKAEGSLPVRRELLEDGRRDLLVRFLPGRHKTARASLRERS